MCCGYHCFDPLSPTSGFGRTDGVDLVDRVTYDLHSSQIQLELPVTVCWSYQFSSLLTLHFRQNSNLIYFNHSKNFKTNLNKFCCHLDPLFQPASRVIKEQGRIRFEEEEGKMTSRGLGLVYLVYSEVSNPYDLSTQTRSTSNSQITNNNTCPAQGTKKEEKRKSQITNVFKLNIVMSSSPPPHDEEEQIGSRSPSTFRNFACAQNPSAENSSPEKTKTRPDPTDNAQHSEVQSDKQMPNFHQRQLPRNDPAISSTPSTQNPPDLFENVSSPTACIISDRAATSTPNHPSLSTTGHQCEHKNDSSNNISASRHDDVDDDTLHSEDLEDHGANEDTENDGDSDIVRKKASGISNITDDLNQLNPENTPDHDMSEVSPVHDVGECDRMSGKEKEVQDKVGIENSSKNDCADNSNKTPEDKLERSERRPVDSDVTKNHDNDCALDTSSSSYEIPSSPDERGKAGLDTDYSSEWVPYVIDPERNMSKSKKRRRRQKRRQDMLKKRDSLGKLLAGKQTKEDEESISTYDHGNKDSSRVQDHDESGICDGALLNKKRHVADPGEDEGDFSASLNSTHYGQDFDSHSFLRGEPEKDVPLQDDLEDVDAGEMSKVAHDNLEVTTNNPDVQKEVENESHSSNSTGGKRRRRRQKKNAEKKQKQDNQESHVPIMETRSRRQQQQPPHKSDDQGNAQDAHGQETSPVLETRRSGREQKGEKEKNSNPSTSGALQIIGEQQVSLFKRPDQCPRSEIQRLVSKAVFKARAKTSTAFTFNSKIQNFQISTNSADVTKMPDIDESAPLIEMTIPEFIWPQEDKTLNNVVNVKSRGVIQFVILVKSAHTENDLWDTPQIDRVRNFASYLMCTIAELKLEFGNVLRWTNAWGNTAVMGLDSSDLDMLLKFRTFFTTLRYFHQFFNTFPKDALTNNHALTVLLRSDLREFKEIYLAEALFARNKLFGILDTLQAETYTAADTTRAGVSKNGWRNVLLEGDQEFLESLSEFPSNHWFNIGPATVQIHGGDRRAETPAELEAKNKRRRFNMPDGQNLTSSAKASIDKSFMEEQRARIQAKQPIARAQSQSYASKVGTAKKKK